MQKQLAILPPWSSHTSSLWRRGFWQCLLRHCPFSNILLQTAWHFFMALVFLVLHFELLHYFLSGTFEEHASDTLLCTMLTLHALVLAAAHHKCCVQLCILEIFSPKLGDAALTQAHMILYTKFANRFCMLLVVVEVYTETSEQRNKHFSNTRNSVPINTWISHRWAPRLWPSYCMASWLLCSTACNLHATWCNTQHQPGNNKQEDTMADFIALQVHSTLYHACYLTAATIAAYVGTSLARAKVLAYFCCCVPHLQARGA